MARKSRKTAAQEHIYHVAVYIRTALYIRLSVEDNKKRGNSIDNQQLVLNDYIADKPEFKIYDTYIDNSCLSFSIRNASLTKSNIGTWRFPAGVFVVLILK